MSTPLPTLRSYICCNCRYSFDITAASHPVPTLVCPSCHQQRGFWINCLIFSFPTTTPLPTSTSTPVTTTNRPTTYTTTRPPPTATTTTAATTAVQTENGINQGARVSSRTNSTSKIFLKFLPSVRITAVDLEESSSCSICMGDFVFGASADKLPCKHLFHKSCIVEWLSSSNTCPLCRFKLPVEPRTPVTSLPLPSTPSEDGLRVNSSMPHGVIRRVTLIRTGRGLPREPRTPVTALPSTPSENNLDGLRVTSSMSPEVIRRVTGRTGRGVSLSNTIGRGVGGDRSGLGSNIMLDDDVQRDADGDIIMDDA